MPLEGWECQEVYMKSFIELNEFVNEFVEVMKQMKTQSHLKSYFFNRYSAPKDNLYFIKLGLVNADNSAKTALDTLLIKYNLTNNVKPYACEMWTVPQNNGVPIDKIKCVSCELHEIIKENFSSELSTEQAFYLIHFLMNQLGLSYNNELLLYQTLEQNIRRQLEGKT